MAVMLGILFYVSSIYPCKNDKTVLYVSCYCHCESPALKSDAGGAALEWGLLHLCLIHERCSCFTLTDFTLTVGRNKPVHLYTDHPTPLYVVCHVKYFVMFDYRDFCLYIGKCNWPFWSSGKNCSCVGSPDCKWELCHCQQPYVVGMKMS